MYIVASLYRFSYEVVAISVSDVKRKMEVTILTFPTTFSNITE